MSKVAFLGLGAMGSRMAAATPREAAEDNDFIIAMVSNVHVARWSRCACSFIDSFVGPVLLMAFAPLHGKQVQSLWCP